MSRRRMMMQSRVVNLFDKNSSDIIYKARLGVGGDAFRNDDASKTTFISPYIEVSPNNVYILIRNIISTTPSYNRWCFYNSKKNFISNDTSTYQENTITIPKNCYYIRFNGLITDIDNVKFYKL